MKIQKFAEYTKVKAGVKIAETAELIGDEAENQDGFTDQELEEDNADVLDEKADPSVVTPKDEMRVSDIIRKGGGEYSNRAETLTNQMAHSITDRWKALRRGMAAERAGYREMAQVFFQRAMDLPGTASRSDVGQGG